jgi:hypothetical protein
VSSTGGQATATGNAGALSWTIPIISGTATGLGGTVISVGNVPVILPVRNTGLLSSPTAGKPRHPRTGHPTGPHSGRTSRASTGTALTARTGIAHVEEVDP